MLWNQATDTSITNETEVNAKERFGFGCKPHADDESLAQRRDGAKAGKLKLMEKLPDYEEDASSDDTVKES